MQNTIQELADDFENERGPFSVDTFPEKRLVDALGEDQKAAYLSLFCTLDYNRAVDNLVSNILELNERGDYFYAPAVTERNVDDTATLFSEIGFRYPNRDAKGWHKNCEIITQKFSGDWEVLLGAAGFSAPTLVHVLRKEGFMYLKGDKLAPFYARVMSDHVHTLDGLWALDIPVDTWVRKLTQELCQRDMTDDEIREFWREKGKELDISPHVVDGGLWMMGYSWDEWGQDYFTELTGIERFKYL